MNHSQTNHVQINRTTPSSELSKVMTHPESFRLLYFPVEAQGQTSRDLLVYGGANWESATPQNWLEEKDKTPFGCLPVLFINKGDKQVAISETQAVENYLAKHFGLMGDNEYEETMIRAFYCSSVSLFALFQASVVWNMPEVREKTLEGFKSRQLAHWVKIHERHLLENGNNGHYIGNKMSLADIRTVNLIRHFSFQPFGAELMEIINKVPALIKLKETVESDPKMQQWKNSDEAKKLADSSKAFFANPFAASGRPTA